MWGVAIGADAGIWEGNAVTHLNHGRHFFQIDLVHDAVASRNHVHVLKRGFGPLDKVEAVFVATVFDGAVFSEGIGVKATAFDSQGVVHNQLGRHDRVDLCGVAALVGDGIAQTGKVNQRGLTQDVMAHHASREPWEVEVALAFNQLLEGVGQGGGVAAAHQVFGQHAGGVRQGGVGTGLDGIDSGWGIKIVQRGTGERFAVCSVHSIPKRAGDLSGR